jgi:hypothetical protein
MLSKMDKSKHDKIIGYVERSVPDICRKARASYDEVHEVMKEYLTKQGVV